MHLPKLNESKSLNCLLEWKSWYDLSYRKPVDTCETLWHPPKTTYQLFIKEPLRMSSLTLYLSLKTAPTTPTPCIQHRHPFYFLPAPFAAFFFGMNGMLKPFHVPLSFSVR